MEIEILRFRCPGLEDGGRFPLDNTGRGKDLSPEITLENLSPQVKTLAVTLEDLSHPMKGFTHWVMWNFPARKVIPGGIPQRDRLESGVVQGMAYCVLGLSSNARKKHFLKAAEGHILQQGSLTAIFG